MATASHGNTATLPSGGAISAPEFERLWVQNGGDQKVAAVMAALMLQQSSGNPDAVNSSDPGPEGSVGLLQINSAAHPDLFAQYGGANGLKDTENNIKAAIQLYNSDGLSPWSTVDAPNGGTMENPVVSAYQKGENPLTAAQSSGVMTANMSQQATAPTNANDTALIPSSTFTAPIAGADVKNFHGYDLSAIPNNELGNAERSIEKYLSDPNYATQLQQRVSQDYGYSGSWAEKVPELNAVLVWAASNLDLSTAAGKDQFTTAVANTKWYQTHDANQRTWAQAQATDPAQAHQALLNAQEKVLADANQIGVDLTPAQLSNLANFYASNTYVQSGSFGTESGTAPEWLDQAIIDTAENIKNSVGNYAGGVTDLTGQTSPTSVTGITSALYQNFQQIAQQYLMYSPGGKGLLNDQQLMTYVDNALKNYTGTGASGQISQFQTDAENQFTELMKQQASQFYPSLAQAITQGTTPQAYVQPLSSLIGNTLGIDPAGIDFTSPTWNFAIATPDPKTGIKTALTQDQILQKITDPNFKFQGSNGQMMSYDNSNNAVQTALGFQQAMQSAFGKGA